MRHHTATHIVNESAKEVLGKHIWQTGAQKSTDRARLDLTHYKRITDDEFREIELLANRAVMKNQPVHIDWMDRIEAEKKYGFVLYQGGVPPGKDIRICAWERMWKPAVGRMFRIPGLSGLSS